MKTTAQVVNKMTIMQMTRAISSYNKSSLFKIVNYIITIKILQIYNKYTKYIHPLTNFACLSFSLFFSSSNSLADFSASSSASSSSCNQSGHLNVNSGAEQISKQTGGWKCSLHSAEMDWTAIQFSRIVNTLASEPECQ